MKSEEGLARRPEGESQLKLPRGIRNNNPLNIRLSKTKWLGQIQAVPTREGVGEGSTICISYVESKSKRETAEEVWSEWMNSETFQEIQKLFTCQRI